MRCEKKSFLIAACKVTAKLYAFAVGQLRGLRPISSKEAYEDMRQISEDARRQCDFAREELAAHVLKHKC